MKLEFRNARLQLGSLSLELNLTIDPEITALFGPSGAGKTSVLELIAGLRRLDHGSILLDGVPLTQADTGIFVPARRRAIGYVPQDLALFPHLTVRQNLAYGGRKMEASPSQIPLEKLSGLLEIEPLFDRHPGSLSGGEKQRVAFARALLASPRLLLLDEPLASLDQPLKDKILPYLKRVWEEFAIPMIYVTHSPAEVLALCGDVIVVRAGKMTGRGKPSDLFEPSDTPVYRFKA